MGEAQLDEAHALDAELAAGIEKLRKRGGACAAAAGQTLAMLSKTDLVAGAKPPMPKQEGVGSDVRSREAASEARERRRVQQELEDMYLYADESPDEDDLPAARPLLRVSEKAQAGRQSAPEPHPPPLLSLGGGADRPWVEAAPAAGGDGGQRDAAAAIAEGEDVMRTAKRATAARLQQMAKEKEQMAREKEKMYAQLEVKKAERRRAAEERKEHALEEEAAAEAARKQLEAARAAAKAAQARRAAATRARQAAKEREEAERQAAEASMDVEAQERRAAVAEAARLAAEARVSQMATERVIQRKSDVEMQRQEAQAKAEAVRERAEARTARLAVIEREAARRQVVRDEREAQKQFGLSVAAKRAAARYDFPTLELVHARHEDAREAELQQFLRMHRQKKEERERQQMQACGGSGGIGGIGGIDGSAEGSGGHGELYLEKLHLEKQHRVGVVVASNESSWAEDRALKGLMRSALMPNTQHLRAVASAPNKLIMPRPVPKPLPQAPRLGPPPAPAVAFIPSWTDAT